MSPKIGTSTVSYLWHRGSHDFPLEGGRGIESCSGKSLYKLGMLGSMALKKVIILVQDPALVGNFPQYRVVFGSNPAVCNAADDGKVKSYFCLDCVLAKCFGGTYF